MAGVFGLTLLYTNLNLSLIRQRYVLAELEEKRKKAENRKKELRIRINRLSSLENIEGTAVSKLGLREPDKSKIVWIKK